MATPEESDERGGEADPDDAAVGADAANAQHANGAATSHHPCHARGWEKNSVGGNDPRCAPEISPALCTIIAPETHENHYHIHISRKHTHEVAPPRLLLKSKMHAQAH